MADTVIPIEENVNSTKNGNVPISDVDFGNVINTVSVKWAASPWLTLQWLTSANFATKATTYQTTLSARQQTGSTRSQTTQALKIMDKTIDEAVSYVKVYIVDKYKKESAQSYYAAFGIVKANDRYTLPIDQNNRSAALTLMINAIAINDFGTKEYGTDFWTDMKAQYDVLLTIATTTDSQVASKVGDKNILKKELKKGLNSIIIAIKANYPDNYKEELRNWGFQKEKY